MSKKYADRIELVIKLKLGKFWFIKEIGETGLGSKWLTQ